jgi:hypothetical protein
MCDRALPEIPLTGVKTIACVRDYLIISRGPPQAMAISGRCFKKGKDR